MSKILKSTVFPVLNPCTKLIGYSMTPQVTGLEYKELRYFQNEVAKHPEKTNIIMYVIEDISNTRQMFDKV